MIPASVTRPRLRAARSLVLVAVALVVMFLSQPVGSAPGGWPAVVGATVLMVAGAAPATLLTERPRALATVASFGFGVGGAVLVVLLGQGIVLVFPFIAVSSAGLRRSLPVSIAVQVATAGTLAAGWAATGRDPHTVGLVVLGTAVVLLLGIGRRQFVLRDEQRDLALARAQQVVEEHGRAAAAEERARIAREVHDVLAHSLSALAVQLQGARLMLRRDGAAADTVAQVERAQRLTADGLAEARQAVTALRTNPQPVSEAVTELAAAHQPPAALQVSGTFDDVDAPVRQALVRTVQEALSNARKHAPGAPVRIVLDGGQEGVTLTVTDHPGTPAADAVPGGHGLVGMTERAELLGAGLETGPTEDGWRIRLSIPRKASR